MAASALQRGPVPLSAGPRRGLPWWGARAHHGAVIAALLLPGPQPAAVGAQAPPRQRTVLVLDQADPMRPAFPVWTTALRRSLLEADSGGAAVVLYTETLDLLRFGGPGYHEGLPRWLGAKYAGRPIDLVVTVGPATLTLAMELRSKLWPGAPIVAMSIGRAALASIPAGSNVTGLTIDVELDSTLAVARAMVPGLRRLALVGDAPARSATRGTSNDIRTRAELAGLEVIDLRGLPMMELRRRVRALPDSTAIIDNGIIRDESGTRWVPLDATTAYAAHSRVPIISSSDLTIGRGATGGWAYSYDTLGSELGDLVRRVLAAGSADSIPPAPFEHFRVVADSRELQRLGIPERRLPKTAELRFREASLLEAYWRWLLGGAILLLLQSGLILGLLVSRRQRRKAQQELEENLRIGRLVAEMEAAFRDVKAEQLDGHVEAWLERLARTLDAERAALSLLSPDGGTLAVPYRWAQPWIRPLPPEFPSRLFPRTYELIHGGRVVAFSRTADSAPPGTPDRAFFESFGTRSLVIVPLFHEATALGCLTFSTVTHERAWPLGLVSELQLAAGIFASALGRARETQAGLKEEAFTSAMIATAASRVAIVNRQGMLVRVSDAWERPADTATSPFVTGAPGDDYLACCRSAAPAADADAVAIVSGIDAVLRGEARRFAHEYAAAREGAPAWFALTVERFDRYEGGAVIAHLDVTQRRAAEHRAEAQRNQVEHIARVAAVSDLAASIAHELNQPLAAILTNAQAAARLVDRSPVPLDDLREILGEIQDDDRRAAEIIGRIRGLLRKELKGAGTIDLNDVIRGVQRLLAASAARRGIEVRLELAPDEMLVVGDRVQLEQVVLNLMTNGFEAMAHSERREMVIATRHDAGGVEVSVTDTGPGIAPGELSRMFEPFFTTKLEGLGLGLSIVQSIVEAGGGSIEADNRVEGGAVVRFYWPAAEVTA